MAETMTTTVANEEVKKITLTPKCALVLQYLKDNDNGEEGHFGADIATAIDCNPKGIHGIMNALVKHGLVAKGSKEAEFVSKDGKKGTKPYTTYFMTEAGRTFEIEA